MKFGSCLSVFGYPYLKDVYSPKSFSMLSKYINESLDNVSEIVTGDVALVDME